MPEAPVQSVRDWSIQQRVQPTLRVGIILERDRHREVHLDITTNPYRVLCDGREHPRLVDTAVSATLQANRLVLSVDGEERTPAESIRLEPLDSNASPSTGIVVRDVIAGRGFHWQQRCNQTLPGVVELQATSDGIVLVNELPLETYLTGVITAEMSGDCPEEFLKAQCVVARSWLLALTESKHDADPFDRCNDDCCQRYQGIANTSEAAWRAVNETHGEVLTDGAGEVVDAVYSKCCGGISERPESVWGDTKPCLESIIDATDSKPLNRFEPSTNDGFEAYLQAGEALARSVYCSPHFIPVEQHARYLGHVDQPNDYYRWSTTQSREQIEAVMKQHVPELSGISRLDHLEVVKRGVSGRAESLLVGWADYEGQSQQTTIAPEYNIRQALHAGFLYSSAFSIEIARDDAGEIDSITLCGLGWGHGAGLCQMGGLGMGLSGKQYNEILSHYFPAATLIRAYG